MLLSRPLAAQTYANEEELKKAATEAFDAEDFQKAFPLYAQLVANYPKDVNYNYRVGVCMLFASNEKDKALEYLQNASKNATVEKEVWFYLGRAYHLGYRFDEAITAYTKYKQLAGDKKAEKMQVDNQLAMCRTGKKLLRAITDITVLDKKELTSEDFFRSYDLSGYSGKLLVKPDDFKTSLDKKKKENSVIFLSGEKTEIYFSSYGNDESNGKDIYLIKKLPNGQWSKPQNVGYPINTEFDEDYPFLHPNGKVLYFCSKGHNSMGGYDIFKSTLNEETNTWTKPVNLDFAINTPDDDILFVTDMDESTAYFSSSRNSKAGYQTVFHVRLDRKPVDQCIIKGSFAVVDGNDNRGANILVKSMDDGSVVGQFKSNAKTGDYLLNLPNGGKFMVTVDKPGQPTQSQPMIIPPQYEIKTLRQEMGYGSVNGQPQLYINTLFDDDTTGLSPDFLRKRANLDPNDDGNPTGPIAKDIDTLHTTDPLVKNDPDNHGVDTTQTVASTSGNDGGTPPIKKDISTGDLLKLAKEDAAQTDQEAKDLDNQANQALAYVDDQNKKAKAANAAADAAQGDADRESDPARKKALQARADSLRGEADVYENNTVAAYSIAEALRRDADTKKKQSKLAGDYAKGLETYSKNNNPKLLDQLRQQEEDLQAYDDVKSDAEESVAGLQQQAAAKKRAAEKAHEDAGTVQGELDDLNKEIAEKEAAAAAEKDPQLKSGYVDQINDLKADRTEKEGEKKKADAAVAQLDGEASSLDAQALLAAQLLTKTKTGDASPTAIASINKNEIAESVKEYSREIAESPETRTFRPIDTSVPVVKNDGGTGADTSNTAGTTTTVSTTPVEDLTKRFDGPLTDANTNSDPLASETAKGQVYHDWEKAIDQEIVKQQQAQSKTKDKKEKDAIAKNITALKQQKKEKHDLAVQSDRKADDLRKTALVKNNDPDTTHNGGINPDSATAGVTLPATPETLTKQFSGPLADADNGKDPLASETAKGQVYHDWETAIDQAIADQQKAQAKTRDKKEKDAIGKNIAALKQQKKETHDLAVASDRKADDLRKTSLVQNNPPDTTHNGGTDPIVKNDGGTDPTRIDTSATSDAGADPNARFVTDLASADTITKTSDREQHKADVQTAWAAAIDKTIGEKKDQLAKTTDKGEKDQLKKDIATLQRESAQHKQDAKTATSVADRARKQEQSQPVVATTSTVDPPFIASMKAADAQTDPYTRDSVKAQVYNDWATALESASAKATDEASKTRDKKKKIQLQQQATFYDSLAREKHDLAAEATTRAEAAHTVADSGHPSTTTQPGDPALYTEPSAGTQRKNSIRLHAEANFYKTSADSLRSLATDPANAGRRDELLADATTADQKAADAEAASDKADADAATTQYTSNNDKLKKYIHLSAESTVPAVTQAALFSDEADTYYKKGQEKRAEAAAATSSAVREEAIRDAEKMEAIAIQKQALALNAFSNAYPGDINQLAKNDGGSNPVKNDGGSDPIVKNDGGSNPVKNDGGSDPIVKNDGGSNPVKNDGGSDPVVKNDGGANPVKNDGGSDPIVKNDGGSNPVKNDGGSDPIVKNDGGSNPVKNDGGSDPVVKNDGGTAKTATTVVNPITSQPFTPEELSQVRSSESFRNYTATKKDADQMETQAQAQRKQADGFRKQSDDAVARSQNYLSQAADQTDPGQKQKLLDQAKEENALSLTYKAKADSVNELADNTEASARSKSGEADLFLNDIDHSTYTPEQMKAVAAADRKASEPVNDGGSDPIVKNDGGSNPVKNDGGSDPVVKNDGGTPGNDGGTSSTGDNATFTSKNKSTIINRLSKSDTYVVSTTTDYSSAKPIPVDQSIPQGLVYRVQIGAFRNPIPQDLFKGISPINGERTASGVTRYTAGQFTAFSSADAAKNEIRGLGYPDAFVVAFYNGKRISIGEAQALSNGNGSNTVATTSGNNGGTSGSNGGNNGGSTTTSGNDGGTSGSNNGGSSSGNNGSTSRPVADNSIAPTTDVQNVNGTFFTVQVGVYSRPVSKAKLYNLDNLFTERLPNGNIRYCSGKYPTAADAISAKNQIVTLGISDAFVTAYSDGQRVSILQASGLSGSTGTTPSGNNGGSTSTPSGNNGGSSTSTSGSSTTTSSGSDSGSGTGSTSTSGSSTTTSSGSDSGSTGSTSTSGSSDAGSTDRSSSGTSTSTGTSSTSTGTSSDAAATPVSKPLTALTDSGLVYKVQIGAFREQVPIEIANKFIRIANRGVKSAVDSETGLTVYTCGGYTTYTDADVLREEAVSKGLNDAFVVAFLNGKKITVEEAKKISGQ